MSVTPFTRIPFTTIDDSNLVSTTVSEDDYPVYDAGTTYNTGDRVIRTTGVHSVFESLVDSNTGNTPEDSPLQWVLVGPTNAWAGFDQSGGTVTSDNQDITFVIQSDYANSIALLGLVGSEVTIECESGGNVYFNETYDITDSAIVDDWFDYFFAPFNFSRQLIVINIPSFINSTYTITISNRGGVAEYATFAIGQHVQYGFTQYQAKSRIIDYSRKVTDGFGTTTLQQLGFAKTMDLQIVVENQLADSVGFDLIDQRAVPNVWVAANGQHELLTVFGFFRDWTIDFNNAAFSYATLQIEGFA